jgi:membrane protein implicated in regulation of membrane protease activity
MVMQKPVNRAAANSWLNLGNEAVVTQTIEPGKAGQVKYQGSWWKARSSRAIKLLPGAVVCVVDRRHVTTLYVEPSTV